MNVWYNSETNEYNIQYNGQRYVRTDYIAAKDLIEMLLPNMVAVAKYAA